MSELATKYDPQSIEDRIYAYWMEHKLFKSVPDDREPFTIVIPPPNVTGVLHMGHMLNNTIQDLLVRRARMQGKNALWVPGTDHASIATEAKVVQKLRAEGIKKSDLSRDAFLEHAWEWTHKHGGIILEQLKKLGASCDWDRTRFTMDEKYYDSVIDSFIDLHKKGKIYRGERMINWDPAALTALSDEEVIYREVNSKLYHVNYQIVDTNEFITIATTRPETILGDTAICVHPKDERYKHLHGKKAIVPIVGRVIPIIADDYVEMEFGTGCLKVTPAHDMNDFMLGEKHQLEVINMMNDNGTISEAAGFYIGSDRFDCRKQIVLDLEAAGHVAKIEDMVNKVGFSERSDAVVEPRLSLQWFVDMKDLSKPALDNVMNDNIRFFPPKFKNSYRNWMENIKDWCISRQLWWGHRIPAWYAPNGEIAVAKTEAEALIILQKNDPALTLADIKQDPDVLDTWFSSWLWPISVFDGFYSKEEVDYYYPTNDLVTAPEIMFFWVARMIIAGYEYRGELPFRNVYYTGIVRDKQGRKMSKSLGNSPDPIELMKVYGADGVRVGMLLSSPAGNDLLFDEGLCEQGRNFANKIWNAFRLVDSWKERSIVFDLNKPENDLLELMDKDLLIASTLIHNSIERYELSSVVNYLYRFVYDQFCGYYLEQIKPALNQSIKSGILEHCLNSFKTILKLLHPVMPFITEEIWQSLTGSEEGSLCLASWPEIIAVNFTNGKLINESNYVGIWNNGVEVGELVGDCSISYTIGGDINVANSSSLVASAYGSTAIKKLFYRNFENSFRRTRHINKLSKNDTIKVKLTPPIIKNSTVTMPLTVGLSSYQFIVEEIEPIQSSNRARLTGKLNNEINRTSGFSFDTTISISNNAFSIESFVCSGFGDFAGSAFKKVEIENTNTNVSSAIDPYKIDIEGILSILNTSNLVRTYIELPNLIEWQSWIDFKNFIKKWAASENVILDSNEKSELIYDHETIHEELSGVTYTMSYVGKVDIEEQKGKLLVDLNYLKGFLKSVEAKLNNEKFANNAPAPVLEGERKKQSDALAKIKILEEKLASLVG